MKLSRFMDTFRRVQPAKPNDTTVLFMTAAGVGDTAKQGRLLEIKSSEFDIAENRWTIVFRESLAVELKQKDST